MKRFLTILSLLMVVALCAPAQNQNPIRWRMSVKMYTETEGTLTLRAIVEPGWHLYDTSMPENGPRPTTFVFNNTGVKLLGNMTANRAAGIHHDEMFGLDLGWWDSDVSFSQKFTMDRHSGSKISVTVSYMGCDNKTCLPPSKQTLTYTFK